MDESLVDGSFRPLGVVVGRVTLSRGEPTWSSGAVIAWCEAHAVGMEDVAGQDLVIFLFDPSDAVARLEMRRVLALVHAKPGITCVVIIPAGAAGPAGVHELARQLEACVLEAPADPGALSRAADILAGSMVVCGLTGYDFADVARLLSPGRGGRFALFDVSGTALDAFVAGGRVFEQVEDAIAIVRCASDVTLRWVNDVACAVESLLHEDGNLLVATPTEEACLVSALTVICLVPA